MVSMKNDGSIVATITWTGEGDYLLRLQKAILLGIECAGSHPEQSGDEDHQEAVWILSDLLRQFMLDQSQTNVGLGLKPYKEHKSKEVLS